MEINTAENVEDSTLAELMSSLGMDESDLNPEPAAVVATQEVKIDEPPAKEPAAKPKTKEVTKRKHYANKVDRLKDRLAGGFSDAMLLTKSDMALTGEARQAKADETAKAIKSAGVKAQNRITFLVEYASGRTQTLNNVMQTALDVLKAQGKITTGNKGNLVQALIDGGKTPATARAMAGNAVIAFKVLRIVNQQADGSFVVNPDSALLERLQK